MGTVVTGTLMSGLHPHGGGRPRRFERKASWALWAIVAWSTTTVVHAEDRWAFDWVRGEGADTCLDRDAMADHVSTLLSDVTFVDASSSDRRLTGTVSRVGPYEVRITVHDSGGELEGERVIRSEAESCSEATHAAALAMALLVDALDMASEPPPAPAPVTAPPLAVPPDPEPLSTSLAPPPPGRPTVVEAPPQARAPRDPPPQPTVAVALGGGATLGSLPSVGAALSLSVVVYVIDGLPLEADVVASIPQLETVAEGLSVELFWLSGSLSACPIGRRDGALSLELCAGARGGVITSSGTGFPIERDEPGAFVSLLIRARLRIAVARPLHVFAQGGLEIPLVRAEFTYDRGAEVRPIYSVAPVVGMIRAGVGFDF